jgi:hypothetical protein
MICHYLNKDYTVHHTANEEPECGEDFCDRCGDCLACYGDGCYTGGDDPDPRGHFWVKYYNEWNNEE